MTADHATPPLEALLAHRDWVRSLARRLTDNSVDADDLEQDAWLAAATAQPRDGAGIRAWFATVMRNRAAERRRLDRNRGAREASVARQGVIRSGSELVVDAEAHARVVQAVLGLDEPYRETVLLRFYEGLPPREVAAQMGVPVDTAKTRLRRAAELLRDALGGHREDWLGALAPLFDLRRGAPLPASAAVAGGIAMQVSAKILVAALVVGAAAAGWFALSGSSDHPNPHRPSPATSAVGATSGRGTEVAQSPRPRIGIDGTTTQGGAPARAHVAVWRVRAASDTSPPGRGPTVADGLRMSDVPLPGPAAREVDSGASGAFALDGLGLGTWRVVARFGDGRRAARVVDLTTSGGWARVELAAPEGVFSLRGRAVHGDGRPFAGWVGLAGRGREPDGSVWCLAGDGGAFAFAGLPPSGAVLFAADGRDLFARAVVSLPHDGEYVFTVDDGGTAVRRGRVVTVPGGAPVPGATVQLRSARGGRTALSLRTSAGADGRFSFVWSGPASFNAWASGYATGTTKDDGGAEEVVVRLRKFGVVAGRVVRADDGGPVAGAVIHAFPTGMRVDDEPTATSGSDGSFRIEDTAPGETRVYVLGGGWASRGLSGSNSGGFDPFALEVEPETTTTVELVVEPAARADGHVVSGDDSPVPEAEVVARTTSTLVLTSRTRTDAGGAFALDCIVPGLPVTFEATPSVGPAKRLDPMLAESGKTLHVEIRLDPGRHIDVTVVDEESGTPIAGALISAAPAPRPAYARVQPEWATDAAGHADVYPIGDGRIGVRASARGYCSSQDDVVAEEIDATHLRATVRLLRGRPIAGRVSAPTGVSVEGVMISARSVVDAVAAASGARTFGSSALTEPDGTFTVEGLPDGAYVVRATTYPAGQVWQASAEGIHPGDPPLALVLSTPDTYSYLALRVLDASGAPVPEARVRSSLTGERHSMSGTADVHDGRARLAVPHGAVSGWIAVSRPLAPGSATSAAGALVTTVNLPDPLPAEFEIRLPAEKRITGRVAGPDGSAVRGVRVFALPTGRQFERLSGGIQDNAHAVARTDADGAFDLGGLGDFTYALYVEVPPGFTQAPSVVAAAGTRDVEVRLSPGFDLTLTVVDPDGRPVKGCFVWVSGAVSNAVSAADGTARLVGVDPSTRGRWWLNVNPPEERDDLLPRPLGPWDGADTTIRLSRSSVVSGVVRDTQGNTLGGALVTWWADATRFGRAYAEPDGRFRVAGLRDGDAVRLRAAPAGTEFFTSAEDAAAVAATAGDANVVLVVDLGTALRVRVEGLGKDSRAPYALSASRAPGSSTGDAAPIRQVAGTGIVPSDGRLLLLGLDPSVPIRLFVGPTAEGMYVLTEGLSPGGPEAVVRLVRGEPLGGRVIAPAGVEMAEVSVSASAEGWSAKTQPDRDGRFRFPGLPRGECDVHAWVWRGGQVPFQGTVRAATNSDTTVELVPASEQR